MQVFCPYCVLRNEPSSGYPKVVRFGFYKRSSDSRVVQRFRCTQCRRGFSRATFHPCYRQNKRQMNYRLWKDFVSAASQRRMAKKHHLSRTTIARKLWFLSKIAAAKITESFVDAPLASIVEFDDMETFEHSKRKPLSITLAVESKTRRILGFEVSVMPAKGLLARSSLAKYGPRRDLRPEARRKLLKQISARITSRATIKSDENPHYIEDIRRYLPGHEHQRFKGKRGCVTGQGEIKTGGFDPLFSLNHTCAMIRYGLSRLVRRTWCTTKKQDALTAHLMIYMAAHNGLMKNLPIAYVP